MKIMCITIDIFNTKKTTTTKTKLLVIGKIESKIFINYDIKLINYGKIKNNNNLLKTYMCV